ncbi:MAG: glycosyltransferase family 2 protein [Paludibacteraceae bacterium]|nr:glycosyltransferase family 2 protein [Paludibacteraceae bacterium]
MNKTITFLIPLYNEEKRLGKTITALVNAVIPAELKLEKIIFVNDGSTDNTAEMVNDYKSIIKSATGAKVHLVSYEKNMGKGYAIKTGMKCSDSDYTLFFDADMATPISELEKFIPFMKREDAVIVGTRKNGKSTVVKHQPKYRELLGRMYTLLSQTILNTWVTDFTCGFKAFSREAKVDIFTRSMIDRWGYDSEILFLAKKLGYKITEKAVTWTDDRNTKVKLSSAVFTSLYELLKIRFYELTGKYNISYAKKLAVRLGLAGN